jgi:hypothetical protein
MIDIPLTPPQPPDELVTVTLYDQATGAIRGVVSTLRSQLAVNVPAGCGHIEGAHDGSCRRINPATLEVEPYQPPQPDADHVWNDVTERWEIPPARLAQIVAARRRQREIDAIELGTLRALREWALGDQTALERLQQADDDVKSRRP